MGKIERVKILGVGVNKINFNQTLRLVEEFIKSKKPHQIVTVNPEFIITALHDKEFREILNKSDLAVPDGIGVILASKILGKPLMERVTGSDLVPAIAKLASKKGYSIYFLGGKPGVAKKTASILKKKYPGLRIAGTESGTPYDLKIIEHIRRKKPDVLFVAFGHPKQEKWIYKYKQRLNVPVSIGVGGAFDFITGIVPRAPLFIQKAGLEWLFRLIKQPWRIKRQKVLPVFVYLVLKERLKQILTYRK